jgi:hypothetical protein
MSRPHPNEQQGTAAERDVAREYDLEHCPDESEWYDCVNPRTGTKFEVKSTVKAYEGEYSDGDPGRYRLWEDQHVSLVRADASGTAWYVFVLYDRDGGEPLRMRRMRPSTVTAVVKEIGDGEWNLSGHQRRGRQQKVPWTVVIDL